MTATPVQTNVARQFLTASAGEAWDPDQRTYVYDEASRPRAQSSVPGRVQVVLADAYTYDSRGVFAGTLPGDESTLQFRMEFEDGEWRIDSVPNALIVPRTWTDDHFEQVNVYYVDPTGSILVPEPVLVPRGEQFATALTQSLLSGPGPDLDLVSKNFFPSQLTVGLSVPVDDAGPGRRRAPGRRVRDVPAGVRAGGRPAGLDAAPGPLHPVHPADRRRGVAARPVPRDPGRQGCGVRPGGLLVQHLDVRAPRGPRGRRSRGRPRRGRRARRSARLRHDRDRAEPGLHPGRGGLRQGHLDPGGADLRPGRLRARDGRRRHRPAAARVGLRRPDVAGRPHRPRGARVSVVGEEGLRQVDVPGITGERVRRFLVSRDGSRFLAVLRRPRGDVVVVSRVQHDDAGAVLALTPAERLPWPTQERPRILDIAWQTTTSVAVLYPIRDLVQVRTLAVDGSPGTLSVASPTLAGDYRWLAGNPEPGVDLYAVTPQVVHRPVRDGPQPRVLRRRPLHLHLHRLIHSRADARLSRQPGACCPDRVLPRLPDLVADLVVGSTCLGCARPGRLVCPACRATLDLEARPAWPTPVPAGPRAAVDGGGVRRAAARPGGRAQGAPAARRSGSPLGTLLAGAVAAAVGSGARPASPSCRCPPGRPPCAPAATTRRTP